MELEVVGIGYSRLVQGQNDEETGNRETGGSTATPILVFLLYLLQ